MKKYHGKRTKLIRKSPLEDVPVELLHHIQSFLPVKEAARTCMLSKSWRHAWLTIPNLNFSFESISHIKYKNFMDRTLLRYRSNNIPIQSFHLVIRISNHETATLVENWIRHVSNPKTCLKELSLDIRFCTRLDLPVTLPLEIFSGENLKSITVTTSLLLGHGFIRIKLFFNSLCSNPVMIKCLSLRVLDLEYVSITDKILANLLYTCKLLENIRLFCCEDLMTVKVKNLAFLRQLKIHLLDENSIFEISNVPTLLMFNYLPPFTPVNKPLPFNMDSLPSVTQLNIRNVLMDDRFFDAIKSKLPYLESLTLEVSKWTQENWVVSSVSLKRLKLNFWICKQFHIQVHTPNLISYDCECLEPAPIISFSTTPPKHYNMRRSTC